MQLSQFPLQKHVIMICARDVAGSSGTRAAPLDRLVHRSQDLRMLAHTEIVVGTPNNHLTSMLPMMCGTREGTGVALEFREDSVASFTPQTIELLSEDTFVVHD